MSRIDPSGWLAYERGIWRNNAAPTVIVRTSGEKKPYGEGWTIRPATAAEVKAEIDKRSADMRDRRLEQKFQDRPEYVLAQLVRQRIEFMTRDNHPLDALTLDEWQKLADRMA